MKHVILGAGPAGVIAAETIRKHAPNDDILIVGDEPEAPYSRMAIPYLLIGNVGEEGTHLRHGKDHFEKLNIVVKRGIGAKAVDIAARTIALDDGSTLRFDRLLIATGSSPASPPIPGIHAAGVHPCWTLKDARAIAQLGDQGRARAADGRRLHRLHHHGGAGRARRAADGRRDGRPHGAAHDGPDGRRHDQGLVREEGRARVHGHAGRGDRSRGAQGAQSPVPGSGSGCPTASTSTAIS